MTKKTRRCSICGWTYTGFGNNAFPINDGRCCDDCNDLVVRRRINDIMAIREQVRNDERRTEPPAPKSDPPRA